MEKLFLTLAECTALGAPFASKTLENHINPKTQCIESRGAPPLRTVKIGKARRVPVHEFNAWLRALGALPPEPAALTLPPEPTRKGGRPRAGLTNGSSRP